METRALAVGLFRVPHLIQLLAFLVRDPAAFVEMNFTTYAHVLMCLQMQVLTPRPVMTVSQRCVTRLLILSSQRLNELAAFVDTAAKVMLQRLHPYN